MRKLLAEVIWKCFGFALLNCVFGLENLRHLPDQADAIRNQSRLHHSNFPALSACIYAEFSSAT